MRFRALPHNGFPPRAAINDSIVPLLEAATRKVGRSISVLYPGGSPIASPAMPRYAFTIPLEVKKSTRLPASENVAPSNGLS